MIYDFVTDDSREDASHGIISSGSLQTADFRMNREIDRGAGYGLSVHVFWRSVFIRQQTNIGFVEGKLSRNNSIYAIHLVQGLSTSIPAH